MPVSATKLVKVRELVGWGFDEYTYRPAVEECKPVVSELFAGIDPVVSVIPDELGDLLARQLQREDLREEMDGLDWRVGLVDLRALIAFQRRLILDDAVLSKSMPTADDWPGLVHVAFGLPASILCEWIEESPGSYQLQSANPNFQMRRSTESRGIPFRLHGGSPFLEVGEYRGRWFLRDGYHRAFQLLRAEVFQLPAVIVRARTLAELGSSQPWFFSEDTLFSATPPRVVDFQDDAKTIEYARPRLLKSIRVRVDETMKPDPVTCSSGENHE
jgi:hypothetical protein